ncbi:MAG: RNase adapter RapZ [Oscillospiraceae bacterium]|nr:RNase adapter RapZ [Oscillospiraceae bacterium]
MQLVIISGYSGAGKSKAASVLEDSGFYCVDNLPAPLIPQFVRLCLATQTRYEKVALVTDIRGGQTFDGLFTALGELDAMGQPYGILFMEASSEVIIKRYKETRRRHPLTEPGATLAELIEREKELLQPVRNRANWIINTSYLSSAKLRGQVLEIVAGDREDLAMSVSVVSFGFKFGLPLDADLVFDVRFLPNPYYIEELREMTGLDDEVHDFIFSYQQSKDYLKKVKDMLRMSLPYYADEGKTDLVIAVGCTGGRHRSVAVAREIASYVTNLGYQTVSNHRDLGRH